MTSNRTHLHLPRWISVIYGFFALVTIPWTFYLAITLPVRNVSSHWDVAWVGLDTGLILMLSATALCAYLESQWIVITATATSTLLLLDAWFDIWTAHHGRQFLSAFVLALFIELPLAIITGTIACKTLADKDI